MIPVATSNKTNGCNPISSNCVVWQGPDIPCIDLCHGDTISEVIYKLAVELCDLLDETSLVGLDLSCLNLGVTPTTQKELLQIIIDKLCSLDGRCTTLEGGGSSSGGGSTTITASLPVCLQYTNLQNDLVTQLPIDDYAELVAARVCDIIGNITTLTTTVNNHETRIVALENANSNGQSTMPQVLPSCILPSTLTDIDEVVEALEEEYCNLSNALGSTAEIIAVNSAACSGLNSSQSLSGQGQMSTLTGWNATVSNLAQSLENLWLTVCDIRTAVQTIQETCCTSDCNDVIFTFVPSLSGNNTTVFLNFSGSVIPSGFTQTNVLGSAVTITDAFGGSYTDFVDVAAAITANASGTVDITSAGLNVASGLTITVVLAVNNSSIDCSKSITKTISANFECPTLTITSTENSIDYSFVNTNGAVNYTVALKQGSTTITSNTVSGAGNTVSGTFSNLSSGTAYTIAVTITAGSVTENCESTSVSTEAAASCALPGVISVTVSNS
jgi:hypothetical protein